MPASTSGMATSSYPLAGTTTSASVAAGLAALGGSGGGHMSGSEYHSDGFKPWSSYEDPGGMSGLEGGKSPSMSTLNHIGLGTGTTAGGMTSSGVGIGMPTTSSSVNDLLLKQHGINLSGIPGLSGLTGTLAGTGAVSVPVSGAVVHAHYAGAGKELQKKDAFLGSFIFDDGVFARWDPIWLHEDQDE